MPTKTGKLKRAMLQSPQNLDGSGAYAAGAPGARGNGPAKPKAEPGGARSADTATKDGSAASRGDDALSKVGEEIHMLAVAQAAQAAGANKPGCALGATATGGAGQREIDLLIDLFID